MTSEKTICERIDAAYVEIAKSKFEKNKTVEGTGPKYNFIPICDILDVVRKAHANNGIKVFFGKIEYDAAIGEGRGQYQKKNSYGDLTTWNTANGHVTVKLIGKDMTDVIETIVSCEAQDNSDKLTNKLYTNAERALYRTLYAIDEGDGTDPEATHEEMTIAAEPPKREIRIPKADPKADPFFSKKTTAKAGASADFDRTKNQSTSQPAPAGADLSREDRISFINGFTNDPAIKRMVDDYILAHGTTSIDGLLVGHIDELYQMVKSVI